MNIKENLIFTKGRDETLKVQSYRSFNGKCYVKYTGSDKEYGFNYSNIDFYKATNCYDGNEIIVYKNERYSHICYAMHQPLKLLIKDTSLLTQEESAYAKHPWTHTDFILFNKIDKSPILVVEVDGYAYHENNEKQLRRDKLKDSILEKYNIPILRVKTTGSEEYKLLVDKLEKILA